MPSFMSRFFAASAVVIAPSVASFLRRNRGSELALGEAQGVPGGEFTWYRRSAFDMREAGLNFGEAALVHSNLGGLGPDSGAETLKFANIGTQDGVAYDMVIKVHEHSNYSGDVKKNILDTVDHLGQINIFCGTESKFDVQLMESGTNNLIKVDRFFLTIFDIDAGAIAERSAHGLSYGIETNDIGPISSFYIDPDTELSLSRHGEADYSFTATMPGGRADNPTDPWSMNANQSRRAVIAEFRETSEFHMSMAATPGKAKRNMLFSGPSKLLESGFGQCIYKETLALRSAKLGVNNLDGADPSLPRVMSFQNAMVVNGTSVDLTVRPMGPYKAGSAAQNGLQGDFAQINVAADSVAVLRFSFTSGSDAFYVNNLFFSFFDIDAETQGGHEMLAMLSAGGTFFLSNNTVLIANVSNRSRPIFNATVYGSAENNPASADVTQDQLDESITFHFHRPLHYFEIAFATPGVMAPRNFAFGGNVALACGS